MKDAGIDFRRAKATAEEEKILTERRSSTARAWGTRLCVGSSIDVLNRVKTRCRPFAKGRWKIRKSRANILALRERV